MDDLELKRWTPEPEDKPAASPMRLAMILAGIVAFVLLAIVVAVNLFGHPPAKSADQVATDAVAETSLTASSGAVAALPPVRPAAPAVVRPKPAPVVKAKTPVRAKTAKAKPRPSKAAKPVVRKKQAAKPAPKRKAAPGLDLDALSKYGTKPH